MKGSIIRAPEVWNRDNDTRSGVFLAGGITNCPQWQNPVALKIVEKVSIVVVDPRRDNWNMNSNHVDSVIQIAWEHKHLKKCDTIIFWFPNTSDCPITLFELGSYLGKNKKLLIGADPEYRRRLDIEVQTSLVDPNLKIWNNLDKMIEWFITQYTTSE